MPVHPGAFRKPSEPKGAAPPGLRSDEGMRCLKSARRQARQITALVGDPDAEAAEAPALVLDLDDLDPADLPGRRDVRAAVGLLVEADDVDDPDLLDLG